MLSRSALSSSASYNAGVMQPNLHGGGLLDKLRKANDWLKRNKVGSKIGAVVGAVGATDYLDKKTGGKFSQGVQMATEKGYGRKRKTRGTGRKPGRPRKTSGSKMAGGRRRR